MQDRQRNSQEVKAFLQQRFSGQPWELSLPHGWGNEKYFAHQNEQACFVKLGVWVERVQAAAALGLTPPVLAHGALGDGTTIIVQPFIEGRSPSPKDYQAHPQQFAAAIRTLHHSQALQQVLPPAPSSLYRAAGLQALDRLQAKWERFKPLVPDPAGFVDESLASLREQIRAFRGAGLVASHNDICNANWLITAEGRLYLIDFESMSMDDPALDIGATLWWYYPPEQRQNFLASAGYAKNTAFEQRMQVRMAMHCLNITLPRQASFDTFDPGTYAEALVDFRAIMAGKENPQGWG